MLEYIAHRINTIEELMLVPKQCGVEVDIRDYAEKLILQHDPFLDGEDFETYLKHYDHGTMILNIKSERIEYKVLELLKKCNIKKYFFLDCSFPMIYSLSNIGENNLAIRLSEFEGMDTIFNMKTKVSWVWIDCFTRLPITIDNFSKLKELGMKLCLVSPELQGQEEKIHEYKKYLNENNINLDAICTKIYNMDKWKKIQ